MFFLGLDLFIRKGSSIQFCAHRSQTAFHLLTFSLEGALESVATSVVAELTAFIGFTVGVSDSRLFYTSCISSTCRASTSTQMRHSDTGDDDDQD